MNIQMHLCLQGGFPRLRIPL
uniref:Uncharacterized protein n=1 Tax=Anguilla anguilla TaxID=7936 RepID=A0A0E9TS05_ANGAN